jgi:hypothetical protein
LGPLARGVRATVDLDDEAAELRMPIAKDGLPRGSETGKRDLGRLCRRRTAVRRDWPES